MLSLRKSKRVKRIIAGMVSTAITMTMIPEVWLPVHALNVSNDIRRADIHTTSVKNNNDQWSELTVLDPDSEDYAALKEELTEQTSGIMTYSLKRASVYGNLLSNEYLGINISSNGRFTIGTTGGDPNKSTDNNKKLLYGHPGGNTSYTTVRVNGESYIYRYSDSIFDEEGGYNISSGSFDGIDVQQKLSLVNNPATGRDDIAEIKYVITNKTEETQNVGLRIMMDTMLGSNDAAPFRVPGYGSITTETEFKGNNIPQFWQAFDNLSNPSVISQGRFYTSSGDKPDAVQFTNWSRVYNTYWNYNINTSNLNGDSAVSIIWDEKEIKVGETREYATYYGLSEFSEDLSLPLALSVYSDSTVNADNGKYSPNPVDVTAYIQNISNNTAENVSAEIVLPEGLSLYEGTTKRDIGAMQSGRTEQTSWKIKIAPSSSPKTYTYKVVLNAADGYTKSVSRSIYVPALIGSEKIFEYFVFSGSRTEDFTLNGWKAYFTGGVYSGNNFVCNLSEFYLDGITDAVGNITANGWKINIPEKNENIDPIDMPELENAILAKAGECTFYSESPSYIQDTNIINGSIMVSGDVTISGTNFEGDCYIIADKNITYNINNLNATGRLVLYSRNGNITINGTNINIDGIIYAPKGKVSFNANETTINGRIWADTINLSGSVFNVKGSDSDLDLIGSVSPKGISKTYTTDEDFSEGTLDGVSLIVPDELTLAENTNIEKIPIEKIYGDTNTGNGIKLTYSSDKSFVSNNGEKVNITYGLSGFGEREVNNGIDIVITIDESGSMAGTRMNNAKIACKNVISQMRDGDRCALVGFNYNARVIQPLTNSKEEMNKAVDSLRIAYDNHIQNGINMAMSQFDDSDREKYILLISDGEDNSNSAQAASAAGEKGVRIFAMMVGSGSLQMQTVAINSNGIYKNAPSADDIGKIMSYFASEVFNTAGRNTTFSTTIIDKNSVDLNKISPAPSNIIENANGSITLEWNFDRISVDETENITIPLSANADGEFTELISDTSCVYYDKNGKPDVIYAEDVILPVSKLKSEGKWSVVYDSEHDGTEWTGIYWNGLRYGDGKIKVTASASDDGVTFGEAMLVNNYAELNGITGRYIRLTVNIKISSDGRSPELFDITVTSSEMPETENSDANVDIYAKRAAYINIPVNLRGMVSDDCLKNDLEFKWSCSDKNAVFENENGLITSVVFKTEGSYTVRLEVSDGESSAYATFDINVSPAKQYDDIDPEAGESAAPDIYVNLPKYADRGQKISAKIEKLNNTEISWYSVIFNNNQAINVSDDGEFTLTMPYGVGKYNVTVRAFDWSGKSDTKEYTIIVNADNPTVEVISSVEKVYQTKEAYFTVNTTLDDKTKSIEYTLNGEAVTVDSDGKYILDTSEVGIYKFIAKAVSNSNKTITASASIEVVSASKPVVSLAFDKDRYAEGDDVIVTVIASDENGIDGIALEYDMQPVELDENNSYTIKGITVGEHTLVGVAWNKAEVVSYAAYSITINPPVVTTFTVSGILDKTELILGETAKLTVTVDGENINNVNISVDVNGKKLLSDTNVYEYTPDKTGEFVFTIIAETSGDSKSFTISANVTEGSVQGDNDLSAPTVSISFDKKSYHVGDDIVASVKAEDNVGVTNLEVTVNGETVSADKNGKYVIKNAAMGTYEIKATAYDAAGNSSWVSASVPVNEQGSYEDTDELTLDVFIDTNTIEIGKSFDINIKADGGVGEKTLSCTINGKIVPVSASKAKYIPEKAGEYVIAVSAVDEAGSNITKTITLTVTESGADIGGEEEEKIVSVNLIVNNDRINDGNHNEAGVGDEIPIFVEIKNLSDSEIESLDLTVNGKVITLDKNKKAVFIPEKTGEYLFNAILKTKDGNVADLKYMLYVTDGNGSGSTEEAEKLTVKIITPAEAEEITAPAEIIGTAMGEGFVKYTLEYAKAGESNYSKLCENSEEVENGVLGKLDPTLLRNGYYDIRLTAYTENANISVIRTVYVTGQMKIGNFSIAFQDMDVKVPGLALTVVRGYDSRDKDINGDFGFGWKLSLTSADISESCNPSLNWDMTSSSGGYAPVYNLSESKAHEIAIDWGNGKKDKFRMTLSPSSSLQPIFHSIKVDYVPQKGTKSKLEAINRSSTELIYDSNGLLMYSNGEPYRPDGYKLTKQDGTEYYFDSNGNVKKITESNGSTIEITHDGIIHSDGKSITYNRDSKGRITSIVSPTGKTVKYTYDSKGDLISVMDVLDRETCFEYKDHYITNIIAPNGVSVSRNIYDDNGRLIKTIDSDGNEMVYNHDIDGRQEVVTDRNGNNTVFVYDDNGNILSKTDANGNTVTNTYDENGNLKTAKDALGNITDYNYSASGDLLKLTDAEKHTVTNTYNSKGQVTSINAMGINTITITYDDKGNTLSTTDALGNDIEYSYDSKGQLTSVTDEIGLYMNVTYDNNGNAVSATNGAGTISQFTYDADGNCTSKTLTYTSDEGVKTVTEQYFYDAAGNLIKIIDSDGNVTTTDYNSLGMVSCATDEKGRKTKYDYDDFGNLVKITYPDNTTEKFTYDREGNNLTATDRMGRTVTMAYDKVGNLISKTYPNGAKISYAYDANYNLISETGANGGITKYEYDKIGRNTAIIDALDNRTTFCYNAKSQLESMTDPMGRTYLYRYDDNGNRIKTIYPDGTSVSTSYDARGRITRQTDQHGYSTIYTADNADRLTAVTNAQGVTTAYTYDEVGNMTSVTDGNGNVTTYAYDDFGRVVKITNALGNSAYTTYDKSGNVLTTTDYAGNITAYTYDNYDRLVEKTTNDGTVNYAYTTDGKISSVTDSRGVTAFTYDNMDGLIRVDYPDGTYVSYSYDEACRLTGVTTPFGTTSYEYDLLDRVVRVVDRNGYATTYEYDANGNRVAVHYANGYTTTYDYDELNRLISLKTIDKDSNIVVQYIYTLGEAGERLKVTELDRTVEYTYDSLYRLTSETITDGEKVTVYTYAYDNLSNRTLKTENGKETVYAYNELNQLVSENDITYEYDLNGNAVRMVSSDKSALYVYNAENRLIRATVQSGINVSVEEYTYDYAGNRITKSSEGEYTKYLLDINGSLAYVLAEVNYDGTEKGFYTRGDELISQERDGKKSYYIYDGHGSVRALVNENGKITDKYVYDAFGNLISSYGSTKNDFMFAGEQFDPVTGLYYLRARYMNPSVGAFISMDSYDGSIDDPVSLHKYLYANANPVMNYDPSGYFTLADTEASSGIQGVLSQIATPNPKALFDLVGGIFDVARDVISTIKDGKEQGLSTETIAVNVASGLVTSLVTNFSCMLTQLGPIGYVLMGIAAIVVAFIAIQNFAEGNTGMGIAQVINLVSIVFSMFSPTCFTGDTEVYTADGLVCIEEIAVGDQVLAYDYETGETDYKEVLNVWIKETDEILHVSTADGETIDTTSNHPFYVDGKGWVAAGDLEIGDVLVTADGDEITVTDVEAEKLAEPILVYNFEVEDFHTYFVGEFGVLVHNYGGKEFDENQQAVIELAKEAEKKNGVSMSEAGALMEFAKEYNVSYHGPEIHLNRKGPNSNIWHFHISKQGHIPILDFDQAIWDQLFGGIL